MCIVLQFSNLGGVSWSQNKAALKASELAPKVTGIALSLSKVAPQYRVRASREVFPNLQGLELELRSYHQYMRIIPELILWQSLRELHLTTSAGIDIIVGILKALCRVTQLVDLRLNIESPVRLGESPIRRFSKIVAQIPDHLGHIELKARFTFCLVGHRISQGTLTKNIHQLLTQKFHGRFRFVTTVAKSSYLFRSEWRQ